MSSLRSAQCLICTFTRSMHPRPRPLYRPFHTSITRHDSHKRTGKKRIYDDATIDKLAANIKPYTEAEKAQLSKKYSPEQIAAIEAGEANIDPRDIASHGKLRNDNYALKYLDDLSMVDDVVDKPIREPYENYDPNLRFKTSEELDDDLADFFAKRLTDEEGGDAADENIHKDLTEFIEHNRLMVGKEEAERFSRSALAPTLPGNISGEKKDEIAKEENTKKGKKNEQELEITADELRLCQQTGMTVQELRRVRVKPLIEKRVVNQTRLGKIPSMYVLAVAGNQDGLIGIGEGKSAEGENATAQARSKAVRNMQPILRYEKRTIFGDVEGKVGAVELKLYNRPPGFGIRCQQYIYEICRCAGIHDLAARVTRSRNPMNTVKAAVQALQKQKDPEDIARARGKKLVDVRKVYYAGKV